MTSRAIAGFDWDDGNRAKCRKHGVSLAEIEDVFGHPHRIAPDFAHSIAESRFLAIGNGGGPRAIFVAFTLRESGGERLIRPISAATCTARSLRAMKKTLPSLTSDEAAERFVAEADLTQFDLSVFQPHSFEFAPKSKQINMRFPEALLDAVKARAAAQGMTYQRFIRRTLEAALRG